MKICIVEDEVVWRDKIQGVIQKYCSDKNISAQINSYSNGKEFLKSTDADLVFLDIELAEGENGFELAEKLINSGKRCKICFLTSHTELARLGYRVNAFRYIDKKHLEEINEALDFFIKTKIQERVIYCKDINGICRKINLNTLLLVETNGRKLRYLMLDGSEHFCEGRISELAQSLLQITFVINLKVHQAIKAVMNGLMVSMVQIMLNMGELIK